MAEARAQAGAILQARPHDLASWVAWGACELAQGTDLRALVKACRGYQQVLPHLHAPVLYLALLHHRSRAFEECVDLLKPIASAHPRVLLSQPKVVDCFVAACLATNNLNAATCLHEAAATLNPLMSSPSLWRVNPAWWARHEGQSLMFRRLQPSDAAWLKRVFSQPLFAQQVNRNYANKVAKMTVSAISKELERQSPQSPAVLGALMLVVEERQSGRPIGIACFVSIDAEARQSELVVGFTEDQSSFRIAELSCFLTHLAFKRLRFRRVTTSIYSSNPKLKTLKSTLRKFGFLDEGVLRAHAMLGPGRFSDVHLMGGMGEEVEASDGFQRHLRRHGPWSEVSMRS